MTVEEITHLSSRILIQYYDNHIQPFIDSCHEDVLWLGPAMSQMIRTKNKLIEAFENDDHQLRFKVYDLTATPIYISANSIEVLLTFVVDTFWPNGDSNRVYQRIALNWEIRKNVPKIRVCNISNPIDYDDRDSIYPVHYLETHPQMTLYMESSEKLSFKGMDRTILYTSPEEILYMESAGNHTLIHLFSKTFECIDRLSALGKKLPDVFLRCHSGYLVNSLHVHSIERFALTMTDGRKIPVPEKKYTAVKAQLLKNDTREKA